MPILIQETATGKARLAMPVATGKIGPTRFAPDGRRLAIATDEGTIEIWQLPE